MKKRNVLTSPRIQEIKRKRSAARRKKITLSVLIFSILFTGLVFLSRWKEVNIQNIQVTGNKIIDSKDIEDVARAEMAGKYLFFFPKTNSLIYPQNAIKKDLEDKFKRFNSISLVVSNADTLKINVSEYTASYTWCGAELPIDHSNSEESKCYFMDDNGYIFDEAPYFSGEVYFRFYGKTSENNDSPLGSSFYPDNFSNIAAFKKNISQMGIKPASLLVKDDNEAELYLSSNTPAPNAPKVLFKLDSDLTKVAENLQAALGVEPLHTDFIKKYSSLLYIDLRFGNKVYYKFK